MFTFTITQQEIDGADEFDEEEGDEEET